MFWEFLRLKRLINQMGRHFKLKGNVDLSTSEYPFE